MKVSPFAPLGSGLVLLLGASPSVYATVDSVLPYVIASKAIQTEGYCLDTRSMLAEIGIPAAAQLAGTFASAPTARYFVGRPLEYFNANALAPETPIRFTYRPEEFAPTAVTFDITVDFSDLVVRLGLSSSARQEVIDLAKLSVIAINKNLQLTQGHLPYRLKLELKNLPSQTGLRGSQVYEKTQYPYTATSPLLAQYEKELINVDGECRSKNN